MAQDYDVSLKLLFRRSSGYLARQLFGPSGVVEWINIEQPQVRNARSDLIARCGDGVLRHVEFENRNHPETPRRVAEYYLGFHRLLNEHVEQVLLFAGREALTMPSVFQTPSMTHRFYIIDLNTMDGEPLLASEDWGDNILALMTDIEKERVLRRVEEQLRKLRGQEQQEAANVMILLSEIIGMSAEVKERFSMIDYAELEEGINKTWAPMGERRMLHRQLTRKFGSVPAPIKARIQNAEDPELLEWADRILTATTLEEIFQ